MPALAAIGALAGLSGTAAEIGGAALIAGTAAPVVGSIYSANKQAGAATAAANTTANAATTAANIQAKSAADALAFQKQQAAQDVANFNTTNQANYNQWLPREQAISSLGTLVGLPARNIPAYTPVANVLGSTPSASTSSSAGSVPTTGTSANPSDPAAIQAALTQNYQQLGVQPTGRGTGPTDLAYYAAQIAATGGLTPQNSGFWLGTGGRIAQDLAKAKGGASGATTATTSPLGSTLAPASATGVPGGLAGIPTGQVTPPVGGTLAMPTQPWQMPYTGSLGSMLGR